MNFSGNQETPQTPIVFWIIWASILFGIFVIKIFVGGGLIDPPLGAGETPPTPLPAVAICGFLLFVSLGIRFIFIPKFSDPGKLMPLMIVGLAAAEGIGLLSLFLVEKTLPDLRLALFVSSVFCILLHAPVYLRSAMEKEIAREKMGG